ncbi:MAG: HD domain-containing protein [Firmicutes bacterium]|nr:HD domain-containing protein [Bacillota bacterium]
MNTRLDPFVVSLLDRLTGAGYACYIVGGAARAVLDGTAASDWDVATLATPAEVKRVFGDLDLIDKGEKHGTIGLERDGVVVEFTTLRSEASYSDRRRPDSVTFISDINEDLSRRDFTVNAFALEWPGLSIVDPFGGVKDMRKGLLRAVGDPRERFAEDALRMMRAVRFVSENGWTIDGRTRTAISINAHLLGRVSRERVRDELSRLLLGPHVARALAQMIDLGLMDQVIPAFARSVGYPTGSPTGDTLDEHAICVVCLVKPELLLRLAALLHDIAKPHTLTLDESGSGHFYGHEKTGAEMADRILEGLRYPRAVREKVRTLVREHMFFYSATVTDAAIRRLIARAGAANVFDLIELRRADAVASAFGARAVLPAGRGSACAAAMRQYGERVVLQMESRVRQIFEAGQAVKGSDLAVDGHDVMEVLGIGPGPAVGEVLQELLDRVMDDPSLNDRERLRELMRNLKTRA